MADKTTRRTDKPMGRRDNLIFKADFFFFKLRTGPERSRHGKQEKCKLLKRSKKEKRLI